MSRPDLGLELGRIRTVESEPRPLLDCAKDGPPSTLLGAKSAPPAVKKGRRICSGARFGTSVLVVVSEPGDFGGRAGQPENVHPSVGAVDDVDEPTVVRCDVVRLDGLDADVGVPLERAAAEVGGGGHGRNEEGRLRRVVGIANVDGAYARIELRDEDELLEEGRPELLV